MQGGHICHPRDTESTENTGTVYVHLITKTQADFLACYVN